MSATLVLVQWDADAARARADELERAGWHVLVESEDGGRAYALVRDEQPAVVVLDLASRPSHSRETARALRQSAAGTVVPLVFVDGDDDDREKVRGVIGDPLFARHDELPRLLGRFAEPEAS